METIENFFFILILSGLCFMLLQTRLLIQTETNKKPIWDFFLSFFLKQKWVRVKNMKKDQPGPLALFKFYCITLSINQKVHSPSQVSLKCGSAYPGQTLPKAQWIRGLSSAYQRNLLAPKVLLDYLRLRSISGLFSSFRANVGWMDGWDWDGYHRSSLHTFSANNPTRKES